MVIAMKTGFSVSSFRSHAACALVSALLCTGCAGKKPIAAAGQNPSNTQDYDAALAQSEQAHRKQPKDAQGQLRLYQLRQEAAEFHIKQGLHFLERHENQKAAVEFEAALRSDPSSMLARQELDYTRQLIASDTPSTAANTQAVPSGKPAQEKGTLLDSPPTVHTLSQEPLTLKMNEDARTVFRTIGKLAGLNVVFDPEFPDNKKISIDLTNVTIQQALQVACVEAKAFWKPVTSNIIMVLPDNGAKRRQEEEQILKKIYLQHTQTAQELTEITTAIQQMLELRHVQPVPRDNAILIRDTPDKIFLANRLIQDSDRGKAEVVVQISVLQVRRDKARSLGIQPSGSTTIAFVPGSPLGPAGGVRLDKLGQISEGDFAMTIPSAVASALASDSATRIIQNPEVRVSDGESARLRVGDRVPIATGSFQATAGLGPVVNTQFQYIDVGVNIDLQPHVLPDHSVSMKLGVEVSSLNGKVNIGGVDQPIISQRRIDHDIRLQEGEVSVLGGLAEHAQSKSVTGWPGLSKLPLLRYLFSGEDVSNAENEVLILVTPKLVRGRELTHESLQALSVGTDGDLMLRRREDAVAPVAANSHGRPEFMEAKAVTATADVAAPEVHSVLRMQPTSANMKVGESAAFQVLIEGVDDLFSASMMFHYDPRLLEIEDVRHGDFLSGGSQEVAIVQRIDKEKGDAGIFTTRQPNTAGVSGQGTLITLILKRLAEGPASLQLTEVGTRSSRMRNLPLKVSDKTVEIQ